MLTQIKIEKILFLDIETVPDKLDYNALSPEYKELWNKKSTQIQKENQTPEETYARAGIYAEFGKIICISFGVIYLKNKTKHLRVKSIYGDNEKEVLQEFAALLVKMNSKKDLLLCAHNGKEFDFPYIARRMLINHIPLPAVLNVAGLKPWETRFLDTLELWKFGDYKHYTSLNLLSHLFGIPSPKSDIDGSMVANVYYAEHDLKRIARYCMNDVIAITQLFLCFRVEEMINEECIEIVE
jgi:3'-5' exonuclease